MPQPFAYAASLGINCEPDDTFTPNRGSEARALADAAAKAVSLLLGGATRVDFQVIRFARLGLGEQDDTYTGPTGTLTAAH